MQKSAVIFVGLQHKGIAFTSACIHAQRQRCAADDERRIKAGVDKNRRDHASGGGLAMRAGHRNAHLVLHQGVQHIAAMPYRQTALLSRKQFRLVPADGA